MQVEPIGSLPCPLDPDAGIQGAGNVTLVDFWRWGYSDVLSNGVRGVLGEYLVALALGVTERPRVEWDAVDVRYHHWRIEVKTTSAHQAWPLASGSKASAPGFSIGARRGWDASTGVTSPEASRAAHCYVLCVYLGPPGEPATNLERRAAVLDVHRWQFHVVATAEFDKLGRQRKIGLGAVASRWPAVTFELLANKIRRTLDQLPEVATPEN